MAAYAPRKKKLEAIELMAQGGTTLTEIAAKVGITYKTLWKWKKEPEFSEAVLERSRALIKENLPDIYKVMYDKAKKGDTQALKLYVEHMERLESMRNAAESGHISFTWSKKDQ